MKNNSFRYLHLFLVVCSLGLIFSPFSSKEGKQENDVRRAPTSLPKVKPQSRRKMPKHPMNQVSRGPASTRPYDRMALVSKVKQRPGIKMAEGNVLAANIGAVPLSEWKPGMAPLIYDDGVFGYFEKRPGDTTSIPVAYNQSLRKLSPISTIVHLRGVDEATRQQLKGLGYQEYYYFKNIRRLSIKSTPGQVVNLYETLQKQGLNVKLEVIQEIPAAH